MSSDNDDGNGLSARPNLDGISYLITHLEESLPVLMNTFDLLVLPVWVSDYLPLGSPALSGETRVEEDVPFREECLRYCVVLREECLKR